MKIILFGLNNFITDTVESMLISMDEWQVIRTSLVEEDYSPTTHDLDLLVASLAGVSKSPILHIKNLVNQYTSLPLLALHYYGDEFSVELLLQAGATGYLQLGSSERTLHEAVLTVAKNETFVATENT
ncbi:MAG: hypothetical protein U5J95_03105 [Balneolaceae bacterium]|nr:hypothetical protein [Balneolaceae bacterium]